jgi:sugar phosphate isomerase/epimerase
MAGMCLCTKVLEHLDAPEALRTAAKIGYRAVELFGIKAHLPADTTEAGALELRRVKDDLGLEIATLCSYVGNFDVLDDAGCGRQYDDFKRYFGLANILGATWIRVNPKYLGFEREATGDEMKRFAEWCGKCADLAAVSDKGICLENNLSMIGTVAGTDQVLRLIGRKNVVVSYDPGNIIRADRENYGRNAVEMWGDRIAVLQVKQVRMDVPNLEDASVFTFYDEGHVNYDEVYGAVAPLKSLRFVSVECHRKPGEGMTEAGVAAREYELIKAHASKYIENLS